MRVLVVSEEASLAVALSLIAEGRDVVSVRKAGEVGSLVGERFDVAVVDAVTTYEGLEVVAELAKTGVTAPCLLLGDVEAPVPNPDVHVLVRPLTLERLDERLSRLKPSRDEAGEVRREGRRAKGLGTLLQHFRRREHPARGRAPIRGLNVISDDPTQEATFSRVDLEPSYEGVSSAAAGRDAVREKAATDDLEAQSPGVAGGEPGEPAVDVVGRVSPQSGATAAPSLPQKPRIYPRFRSETAGAGDASDIPLISPLGRALSLLEELQRMLDERPDLVDPRAVMRRILDEVEWELHPEGATIWVPREDNTYEAYETRGLGMAVGIRVPQEQSLFQSFKEDVDGVLIEPLDVSRRPVSGIPGLVGESLVAAALRLGRTLLGVVIATGTGFTTADRERLDLLVCRAAPALAVAGLIERLRARRFPPVEEVSVTAPGAVWNPAGSDLA